MCKNGFVYTVDAVRSRAQAFAVGDGKFLAVGSNDDMMAVTGKDTKVVDLKGKMVMPGLVDTTIIFPVRDDSWGVGAASRSYCSDLLNAGVKIYEYVGGLLHTKSLTLDGEVTLIGSANMDRRSFDLNYENNILLYDARIRY